MTSNKQSKEIQKVYDNYKEELSELKNKQDEILGEFRQKLEEKKLEEIRDSIKE